MGRWIALSLWLVVGAMPMAATAGTPRPLAPAQMDKMTAGAGDLQLNVNVNTQVAVPIAVAVAACGICGHARASALALARNVNVPTVVNIHGR